MSVSAHIRLLMYTVPLRDESGFVVLCYPAVFPRPSSFPKNSPGLTHAVLVGAFPAQESMERSTPYSRHATAGISRLPYPNDAAADNDYSRFVSGLQRISSDYGALRLSGWIALQPVAARICVNLRRPFFLNVLTDRDLSRR